MGPDAKPVEEKPELSPDILSLKAHRLVIGALGAALPPLLYVVAGFRHTKGIDKDWALLEAVSSYYYTGAVSVFVGVLFALSLFLFTYRGYREELSDRWIARIGGLAGLIVAIVPTEPPDHVEAPLWWEPWQGKLHYAAATVLFGSLAVFCLWLFRKSKVVAAPRRPTEKRVRNTVFLVCGVVILLCMLWAFVNGQNDAAIFWPETGAIEAFAFSWILKSGVHEDVARAVKRRAPPAPPAPPAQLAA